MFGYDRNFHAYRTGMAYKWIRIYSLFTSGMKLFNRYYDSSAKKYKLKFDFVIYDI